MFWSINTNFPLNWLHWLHHIYLNLEAPKEQIRYYHSSKRIALRLLRWRRLSYRPRILGFTIEDLKFRLKVLHDLGLSPEEIAKIMSSNPSILHLSTKNRIIPRLSMLKGLVGSNQEVARLLRKSAWFLQSDLEKTLMPNVEILKSCGISMERILRFLYTQPRCFLMKPDIEESVDKAIDIGVSHTSTLLIHAARVFSLMSEGMWEVKLQTLRDLGFSDDDIFSMFRKQPMVFALYMKKMKNVIKLVLATGKYNISSIVSYPASLGYSIEKRLEPRLQILGVLESRNLIEKWPALSTVASSTDDNFLTDSLGLIMMRLAKNTSQDMCRGLN